MKKILTVFLAVILFVLSLQFAAIESSAATVDIEKFADYMYTKANQYEQSIDVTSYMNSYGWSLDDLKKYVGYALLEKPEMYFVDFTYRVGYTSNGEYIVMFTYLYNASQKKQMDAKLNDAAKKAASGVSSKMSDAEKALIVHDYIILNCKYDQSLKRRSAYDCLVDGVAVCQGYTLAYKYVLEKYCGIECSSVISESQNHIWNYVRINGKWYHADLTSDDACFKLYGGKEYDAYGEVLHSNLLMSDSKCKKSSGLHKNWEVVGNYGKASDTTFDNFFWCGSSSPIYYSGGNYYFVREDKDSPMFSSGKVKKREINVDLMSYSFKTGKTKKLCTVTSAWYARRSVSTGASYEYGTTCIKRSFTKLAVVNGNVYMNTAREIYRYNISEKKLKKVYTLKKDNMQIFSLRPVSGGKIRLCYKYDTTYKDNYLNLNISA